MRVLVYGAGVIGSVYAARLHDVGTDVTILARGERAGFIRDKGIVLVNGYSGEKSIHSVPVIERVTADDCWDLVVVTLQMQQITDILPGLCTCPGINAVLFLGNNTEGGKEYARKLGKERVLLGFPGAGGYRKDQLIYYIDSGEDDDRQWGIAAGTLNGSDTGVFGDIRHIFEKAGIDVSFVPDIGSWLISHAAFICPLANALYAAGDSIEHLSEREDLLNYFITAVREGFRVQKHLGIPVIPRSLKMIKYTPFFLLKTMMRKKLNSTTSKIGVAGHALSAKTEMKILTEGFRALINKTDVSTPAIDFLSAVYND